MKYQLLYKLGIAFLCIGLSACLGSSSKSSESPPNDDLQNSGQNQAPAISGTPATTAMENQVYSFSPLFNDADGDTLTFSINTTPSWASFDTSTGALTGTPTSGDVGSYNNLIISVSDGTDTAALAASGAALERQHQSSC